MQWNPNAIRVRTAGLFLAGLVSGVVLASDAVVLPDVGPVTGSTVAVVALVAGAIAVCGCRPFGRGCSSPDCDCC